MEHYELDKAVRPILHFIDDLSTWYLRRSRERFKAAHNEDKIHAIETTRYVLHELSKVMAPFTPFIAEEIYQGLRDEEDMPSVHLEKWPQRERKLPVWPNPMAFVHRIFGTHEDLKILSLMEKTRYIVSLALEARMKAGIKVRQPLASLKVKEELAQEYFELIRAEINVKDVIYDKDIKEAIELDTKITPLLKKEGQLRDLVRYIQDMRKVAGLEPTYRATLLVKANEEGRALVKEFREPLKIATSLSKIEFSSKDGSITGGEGMLDGEQITIDNLIFYLAIKK